jgi:drug/metabolite transporter (DMT)-like permease
MSAADVARLLTLAALWGGSFVFMRVAVPGLGPLWLAESRVALAFIALFALALAKRRVPALRERWRDYLVIGVVNSALPFALFCFAEQYVGASTAAILNATSPFFAAIVAVLWLKDRLSPAKLAGMGMGIGGVILLVGWQPEPLTGTTLLAVIACLAAALCYGVASVYAKARMTGVPSFAIALYSQMAAAIVLAPALPLAPPQGLLTPLVAANVLALALASTALAYLLYFRLIATIGPARALAVTFLIPLFGVLWGFVFLGEAIGANTLTGCALILTGTWLAVRGKPRAGASRVADQTSSKKTNTGSDELGRRA